MSIDTDLSKLKKLIKKFHAKTFTIQDYKNFVDLVREQILLSSGLLAQALERTRLIAKFNVVVEQMTKYVQTHQMPQYKSYAGDHQIFRLRLLDYNCAYRDDKTNGIFLVSKSVFIGKEIKPGVYHWQHPPAYGYDEADIVNELTPEYIEKLNLSNEHIAKIIENANVIMQDQILQLPAKEDRKNKHKERWPNEDWISSVEVKIIDLDKLGELDVKQLEKDFDVEISVDFDGCTITITGPDDKVKRLWKQLESDVEYIGSVDSYSIA